MSSNVASEANNGPTESSTWSSGLWSTQVSTQESEISVINLPTVDMRVLTGRLQTFFDLLNYDTFHNKMGLLGKDFHLEGVYDVTAKKTKAVIIQDSSASSLCFNAAP